MPRTVAVDEIGGTGIAVNGHGRGIRVANRKELIKLCNSFTVQ
jgi:hypothetical protein